MPINSGVEIKKHQGEILPTKKQAKISAIFATLKYLYTQQLLDDHFLPIRKLSASSWQKFKLKSNQMNKREIELPMNQYDGWDIVTKKGDNELLYHYNLTIIVLKKDNRLLERSFQILFPKKVEIHSFKIGNLCAITLELIKVQTVKEFGRERIEGILKFHQLTCSMARYSGYYGFLQWLKKTNHSKNYNYLFFFEDVREFPDFDHPNLFRVKNYKDPVALENELNNSIVWIPNDNLEFFWYFKSVDTHANPNSLLSPNETFKQQYMRLGYNKLSSKRSQPNPPSPEYYSNHPNVFFNSDNSVNSAKQKNETKNECTEADKQERIEQNLSSQEERAEITISEINRGELVKNITVDKDEGGEEYEEIEDNQPLINIKKLIKGKNFADKKLTMFWKNKKLFHAIPQFCAKFPLSATHFQTAQIIPSIMYEIEHKMIVKKFVNYLQQQLWSNIDETLSNYIISPDTILNTNCANFNKLEIIERVFQIALTAPSCSTWNNYELFETLGDSFVKFYTSDYIYHQFKNVHEGILSHNRILLISNEKLYQLAVEKNLLPFFLTENLQINLWEGGIASEDQVKNKRFVATKTIADTVEAIIAACLLLGNFSAAGEFCNWLGLCKAEGLLRSHNNYIHFSESSKSLHQSVSAISEPTLPDTEDFYYFDDFYYIENEILKYKFTNFNLLENAFSHGSYFHGGDSYQRLEFLGDAILDILITLYFFNSYYNELNPHLLSLLRSEAGNTPFPSFYIFLFYSPFKNSFKSDIR